MEGTHDRPAHRAQGMTMVRRLRVLCDMLGFQPGKMLRNLRGVAPFLRDLRTYRRMSPPPAFQVRTAELVPILEDRYMTAGTAGGHYFHQDLWAARKIYAAHPEKHIDIGSRIDGFVAHLLTFMPVTLIDIRQMQSDIEGLGFVQDDATRLAAFDDASVASISSLHAAEHFGLGRYSDPVDPLACFSFMRSLQRVVRPGGRLYFSVPIGRERLEFNAHRVFSVHTVLSTFHELTLVSFSFVDDSGRLTDKCDPALVPELEYGCGLFEFTRPFPSSARGYRNAAQDA